MPVGTKAPGNRTSTRITRKKEKPETPQDRLKMEIARELGLADKVKQVGWGGLTAAETGRIGGLLTKRLKDEGDRYSAIAVTGSMINEATSCASPPVD